MGGERVKVSFWKGGIGGWVRDGGRGRGKRTVGVEERCLEGHFRREVGIFRGEDEVGAEKSS